MQRRAAFGDNVLRRRFRLLSSVFSVENPPVGQPEEHHRIRLQPNHEPEPAPAFWSNRLLFADKERPTLPDKPFSKYARYHSPVGRRIILHRVLPDTIFQQCDRSRLFYGCQKASCFFSRKKTAHKERFSV